MRKWWERAADIGRMHLLSAGMLASSHPGWMKSQRIDQPGRPWKREERGGERKRRKKACPAGNGVDACPFGALRGSI